jgi:bacillithiol system protein YtxJ
MNWIELKSPNQLETLRAESKNQPVIIFKHSTRCSISQTALNRLERNWQAEEMRAVKFYFLDLLTYREISNQIADLFDVEHQSPQVIIINEEKVIYHKSHFEIDFHSIKRTTQSFKPKKSLDFFELRAED